ncbi:MAG: hypothetical protein C4334_03895 [Pyrinomonas sp.]
MRQHRAHGRFFGIACQCDAPVATAACGDDPTRASWMMLSSSQQLRVPGGSFLINSALPFES